MTVQGRPSESMGRRDAEQARAQLLAAMPVTERRLRLGGISTAVLDGGAGTPIVLLHGPGGHAAGWLRVIPELVKSHRVIAPDLPGHGETDAGEGPLRPERVLAWLSDVVEQLCPSRPAIVGHLVGGAIAARFAIDHGDRLSHLVLVDAFGLAAFQPAPDFAAAIGEYMTQPSADTHERLWRLCAHDLDRVRREIGERWAPFEAYNLDRARAPASMAALHALMEQFAMPQIPPADLERIRVPTILVWGRHDLATPVSIAEAASARYGWPIHVIEHANDDPSMDQPEAFVRTLLGALESPRRAEATR